MDRNEIIRMAREAGLIYLTRNRWWMDAGEFGEEIERFAALVAAAAKAEEREACEALYSHEDVQAPVGNSAWGEAYQDGWIDGAQAYRDAIRARGQ